MPKVFVVLLFISLPLIIASTVKASHLTYEDFYDWGPWYYHGDQRVLGEETSTNPTTESTPSAGRANLKSPSGLLPNHPFYLFKSLGENLALTFTFDNKSKERARLDLAEERLAETKALVDKSQSALAAKNFQKYQDLMETVSKNLWNYKQKNQDVQVLAKEVEVTAAKHSLVIEKIFRTLPTEVEYRAEQSLKASQKAMDVSSDVLGRDPLPSELKDRLESLRSLGILRQGEIAAIFVLRFRDQVREEVERLVKQNLLPEADVKRLDEAQLGYFPTDYLQVSEIKKLEEFKKLEDLKPDETTLQKIADFASNYKPGESIPPDLRKWWVPLQRYEELQSTLRPDLIGGAIITKDPKERQTFQELIERFKPTQEDLKVVESWVKENPGKIPPPEIQRVAAIAVSFGTAINWSPPEELKKAISSVGFPSQNLKPAGFSTGSCQNEDECKKACERNPLLCSSDQKDKKVELARSTTQVPQNSIVQKQVQVSQGEVKLEPSRSPETGPIVSPLPSQSISYVDKTEKQAPTLTVEPSITPIIPKGYSSSFGETGKYAETSPEPEPSPTASEPPKEIIQPPPSNPPSPSNPSGTTGDTTQPSPSPTSVVDVPTVSKESPIPLPSQAARPPQPTPSPSPTPPPTPQPPGCPNAETRARNAFTGEIKVFSNTCLPSSWYPYSGSDDQGEFVIRYKSKIQRYFFPHLRRSFKSHQR